MNIEKIIVEYLSDKLDVPVFGDRPDLSKYARFVTVEKIGGGRTNHINRASIAVQSWETTRATASDLNETVKAAMLGIVEIAEIAKCELEGDYNYTHVYSHSSSSSPRPRYQTLYEIIYY